MVILGSKGDFFKRQDVNSGDVLIFKTAGEENEVDFSKSRDGSNVQKVFQITVQLPSGAEKLYTPNKTTLGLLKDAFGTDTAKWVGKQATVKFIKQLAFGKMTDVLVLEPVVG